MANLRVMLAEVRRIEPVAGEECASLAGIGKPLELAAGRETDATVRGSSPDALMFLILSHAFDRPA
jgi:hypothetical protein